MQILEIENTSHIETPEICIPVFEHASASYGRSSSYLER